MARSKPKQPDTFCANPDCRKKLRPGGRRPSNPEQGRFCIAEECQAMKYQESYRARRPEREDAPTKCSCCGDPLPPRKKRRTDSPFGRWCRKKTCEDHRTLTHELQASGAANAEQARLTIAFAEAAMDPEKTVACEECGLETAVAGFIHPYVEGGEMFNCFGVGDKGAPGTLARKRWPNLFV